SITSYLTDTRYGHKQRTAGLDDAVKRSQSGSYVIDQMQSLRKNDAVETVGGEVIGVGEIGDDCRVRSRGIDIKHVARGDALAAEASGIPGVADFQHTAMYLLRV